MRRRELVAWMCSAALAWPVRAEPTVRRIGLLASLPLPPIESFRKRLAELGYAEGKSVAIVPRFAEGGDGRYPALAWELAALPVDVIVAWGTPASLAAKRATAKIPIVVVTGDVVNTGIVSNLARPEANVTGVTAINVELEEKRLELLKEVVPRLKRVAILANWLNPLNRINLETAHRVARDLSLAIDVFQVHGNDEVEGALRALVGSRPDAALLAADTLLLNNRKLIADTMARNRIPAIYPFREYADVGGFITYGANLSIMFRRAAEYVDRILKGERPRNLPVQQATAFELIVSLKAAAGLGLTVPQTVQVRADEIIE